MSMEYMTRWGGGEQLAPWAALGSPRGPTGAPAAWRSWPLGVSAAHFCDKTFQSAAFSHPIAAYLGMLKPHQRTPFSLPSARKCICFSCRDPPPETFFIPLGRAQKTVLFLFCSKWMSDCDPDLLSRSGWPWTLGLPELPHGSPREPLGARHEWDAPLLGSESP